MIRYAGLVITILFVVEGCKVAQNPAEKDPVVATLGGKPVYQSEFRYVYDKNAMDDSLGKEKSTQEYLDLYLNFRLKVMEAESQGLDTLDSFEKELAGYRDQLAEPYLVDSSVTQTLVREAYERMKEEIRASHILINLPSDADPKDTAAAYQRLADIRNRALKGDDFNALASQYSQDPSARMNGGDLGYFTALQMVYPFEDAAYQTPVGKVSMPFRTRFGYHIVRVADRRPSQGKVKAAHIMIRTNPELSAEDSLAAKQKIDEIYQRLRKGANWDQMVREFSEDGSSKTRGGVLPVFSTGNMIPAFEEAAFALKNPGDLSQPVLTPYGWHVIKLIEHAGLEPFSQLEKNLRQKVSKDSRSELNKTLLIKRLKSENKLEEQPKTVAWALEQATDSLPAGKWNYAPNKKLAKTLFTIHDQKFTVENFFQYAKEHQQAKSTLSPAFYMRRLYDEYVDEQVFAYEKAHLEEKYPDYRYLVREYRDGMLLFQQMETNVWSRALTDTVGQKAFYEKNTANYQWKQRVTASVYSASDAATLAEVKEWVTQGKHPVTQPVMDDLYFDLDKSELRAGQKTMLDKLLTVLTKNKKLLAEVAGHADLRESEGVSAARAKAVADYLVAGGVDVTRIILKDFSRFQPVSKTDRRQNRRVTTRIFSSDKEALETYFNARKPLSLNLTSGIFQRGDNANVDRVTWKPGAYTLNTDGRAVYVVIEKVEEPRAKTFAEARGAVISDYQNYLEQQWIGELRRKYPVVVNEEEVQRLQDE